MRLGQLARQLSISPDKIVRFLGSRDVAIDSHNNARVDDAYVDLVLQEFAPGNESLRQQVTESDEVADDMESPETTGSPEPDEAIEVPELIKAPKIELPGLRVVGKIELPEKKKPEPPKEAGPELAKESDSRPAQPSRNLRRTRPQAADKNPIALAREREEREKERRLAEAREQEKQRKAAYYQKRLKPQPPTKAVRMVAEEVEEMPALAAEQPKTFWGRFLRWLNN